MEAITVRPSLDKFLNVVITKNAEALHHQAHKPHEQTNKQPQERREKLLQASSSSSDFLLPEHYYCFLDLLLLREALVPVEAAGGFVQEKHARTSENLKGNAHSSLLASTQTSQMPVADGRVGTVLETHVAHGSVDYGLPLRLRHSVWQPQICRVVHRLSHR